jgi:EamA-like transporter family.
MSYRKWTSERFSIAGYGLILLAILFQSMSAVFGKYASMTGPDVNAILNVFYLLSISCLVLQAVVWQKALCRFPLSVAYPLMSLMNFVVLIAAYIFFGETITPGNVLGLLIISAGIFVLMRGKDTP